MFHSDLEERIERLERKTEFRVARALVTTSCSGNSSKAYVFDYVDINDVVREILNHLNMRASVPFRKSCELVKIEEDVKED